MIRPMQSTISISLSAGCRRATAADRGSYRAGFDALANSRAKRKGNATGTPAAACCIFHQ